MFAAARQRIRPSRNVQKRILKKRRRVRAVTATIAASLHEELVAALTPLQLQRLETEFKALDGEGFGFIRVKELASVSVLGCVVRAV